MVLGTSDYVILGASLAAAILGLFDRNTCITLPIFTVLW